MTDMKTYKARKSFKGIEGSWRRGQERPLDNGRGTALVAKGLVELVTDKAVQGHETKPPKHETKPPKPGNNKPPKHDTKPPLPLSTKSEGATDDPPPPPRAPELGEPLSLSGSTIVVGAHKVGELSVLAAVLAVEPGRAYSVFARPDGSTEATAEQEAAEAITASGGVLLDVIRVPEAPASGNGAADGSNPSTGAAEPSSSSPPAPAPRKTGAASQKPKPAKGKASK